MLHSRLMRLCLIAMGAPLIYGWNSDPQCDPEGAGVNLVSVVVPSGYPPWPNGAYKWSAQAYCIDFESGSISDSSVAGNWYRGAAGSNNADTCFEPPGSVGGRRCRCTSKGGVDQYCDCVMSNHEKKGWCFRTTTLCQICAAGKFRSGCGCDQLEEKGSLCCNEGTCMPTPPGYYSLGFSANPLPCSQVVSM